jgi:hypothetical protein
MPLTPFIGLSVLLHIGIIFMYRVFRVSADDMKAIKKPIPTRTLLISYAIVCVVFLIVLSSAATLINVSIHDRHSIFNMIHRVTVPTPRVEVAYAYPDASALCHDRYLCPLNTHDECMPYCYEQTDTVSNGVK